MPSMHHPTKPVSQELNQKSILTSSISVDKLQTLYFAHPVSVFDTPLEKEMIKFLTRAFQSYRIENPNQPHHQKGYEDWKKRSEDKYSGMGYYYNEVLPNLDGCVSMPFLDGKFGSGVAGEAGFFIKKGQPSFVAIVCPEYLVPSVVREITEKEKQLIITCDPSVILSVEETRARTWVCPKNYGIKKLPYYQAHLIHFEQEKWASNYLKSLKYH